MRVLLLLVASLFVTACAQRTVEVVDAAGAPIAGAQIIAASPSANAAPVLTDAKGKATVPTHISVQAVKWVIVSKPGFQSANEDVPAGGPVRVTLRP